MAKPVFFGGREVEAALGELTLRTAKAALERGLLEIAEPMRQAAENKAPERDATDRDKTYVKDGETKVRRKGTLKALVQKSKKLTRRQASQARREGRDTIEVYVGTRDRVGILAERGTSRSAPKPFLTPAWESGKGPALAAAPEVIMTEVNKSVTRARKRGGAGRA